ncbi:hypothetical protein MFRU_007g02710 [Monilinia fructicola]|nr:hypothetical protein MFRU_007g02710 [Monilinia fructicola]
MPFDSERMSSDFEQLLPMQAICPTKPPSDENLRLVRGAMAAFSLALTPVNSVVWEIWGKP